LQGQKLLEVRTGEDGRMELRSTPRKDERFQLDEEFANFLPRTPAQVEGLERQLLTFGCLDPLIVWKEELLLVDGYCRYDLMSLLDRPYPITYQEFANRRAVLDWLWELHYGRRNLTAESMSYHVGRQYLAMHVKRGGDHTSRRAKSQNETLLSLVDRRAQRYHKARATIHRDARFTEDLDLLVKVCGGPIRDWVLTQGGHRSLSMVRRLAQLEPEAMRQEVEVVLAAGKWLKGWPGVARAQVPGGCAFRARHHLGAACPIGAGPNRAGRRHCLPRGLGRRPALRAHTMNHETSEQVSSRGEWQ
jgi:hypothetical protein